LVNLDYGCGLLVRWFLSREMVWHPKGGEASAGIKAYAAGFEGGKEQAQID
jgi:hypothetical protein